MGRDKLGLIAGGGEFPLLVTRGAKHAGLKVVCLGFRGLADKQLTREADKFVWVNLARIGEWIRALKKENVRRVIICGSVKKTDIYTPYRWLRYIPDWRTARVWYRRSKDRRTNSLLLALVDELAEEGITMEDSVQFCQEDLAGPGPLGTRKPTEKQTKDIAFGWKIAKAMGGLDIGQSVCVRELEVIAVEAIEGTDQTIRRAGELCRVGGFTVIKVAKPNQDMRFDVPTVGAETLEVMHQAGAAVLAVEAGKTLVINRQKVRRLAAKYGLVVIGIVDGQAGKEPAD
ncbi:MAG: UDP-2,3-diacylglucosamine diphosphatase LpxI [Actinobacteria bacterium]|nr:UDP-2,3-diacylglucosamine diphosphatase LpxI [Actinomycetota bacterium]